MMMVVRHRRLRELVMLRSPPPHSRVDWHSGVRAERRGRGDSVDVLRVRLMLVRRLGRDVAASVLKVVIMMLHCRRSVLHRHLV